MGAANTRFHVCRGRRGRMKGEDGKREGMRGEGCTETKEESSGERGGWMWEDGRMRGMGGRRENMGGNEEGWVWEDEG